MNRNAVLVVGSANMDLVVTTDRFPRPGETLFGETFNMYPGGKGANQAVACAKLGGAVCFLGKLGMDSFGEKLTASMERDGVDMHLVRHHPTSPTGIAHITVDASGQNQIIVLSGSNMELTPEDIRTDEAAFTSARVLLVQLEIPLRTVTAAIHRAYAQSVTVILNPAPARKLPRSLLSMVDYLTPNETELETLSGMPIDTPIALHKAARKLLSTGLRNVLVTLGPRGAMLVNHEGTRLYPTRRVRAVDTTAAGDTFNGALAFALAKQYPTDHAIHFANGAAAFSVTRTGAQTSMPTMPDIDQFLSRSAIRSSKSRSQQARN